jgi:hypothetical protein
MLNRIRRFIDSLVFAGLKPSGGIPPENKPQPRRRFATLRYKIELFLSGGPAHSDPLYLSNRTWKQKLRVPLLIGVPTAVVFGVLALVFTNIYTPKAAPPPKEPTATEIMAKLLPDVEKTAHVDTYKDAEIVEIGVTEDGPRRVVGILKNNTNRVISVELDVDIADHNGGRVSSATERVNNAQPNTTTPFEFPARSPEARYALVRKLRTVQ